MVSHFQNTVYRFLKNRNVRTGEHKTPLYVLYKRYYSFCDHNKIDKRVSPIEFGRRMSKYFLKGKSGRYAYYLTNVPAPKSEKRRRIKLWYNRKWARMRNGEEKKR